MKLLLSFLFSMSILLNLNAQETKGQFLLTGGVLFDKYTQRESFTQMGAFGDYDLREGTPVNFISDGREMRGQFSLGLKKINTKGDFITINVFIGGQSWGRRSIVEIEEEDFGVVKFPIYIGNVEHLILGLNTTKSFCVSKEESRLRAYIGVRAEGSYTEERYHTHLEGKFRTDRQQIDFQLAFTPEVAYFFPGDRFAVSLGLHLPGAGLGLNKEEIFNHSLTEEQRIDSYASFDFMNLEESRFEIGFGWVL